MHLYRIVEVYDTKTTLDLTIVDDTPVRRTISLNKHKRVSQFKTGRGIIVLRDVHFDMDDIVYICDGQLYFNQRPHGLDQYSCECFIDYVAGWENGHSFDRDILKSAIAHACEKNKIELSEKPNINLLNLLTMAKGY